MSLATAFSDLVENEGTALDLNPLDRGNWTGGAVGVGELKGSRYGISAAAHPDVDIANLNENSAMALYDQFYWKPIRGDELPDALANELFDEAVNSGVTAAVEILQGALGVIRDGVFGPATLTAVGKVDPGKLAVKMIAARLDFYTTCQQWSTAGKGWARRIAHNLRRLT